MWRHTILCNLLPLFIPGRKRSTVRIPSNRHREFEYDDIVNRILAPYVIYVRNNIGGLILHESYVKENSLPEDYFLGFLRHYSIIYLLYNFSVMSRAMSVDVFP